MADIIKTIESWRRPRRVHQFLAHAHRWEDAANAMAMAYGSMIQDAGGYYAFQLGRGEPQRKPVGRLWFVFRGRLYGSFEIARIERNVGQFEDLVTMYKHEGLAVDWHLRPDNWVAICKPPFAFFKGAHVYYEGFQGWRYFEFEAYSASLEAKYGF